MDRWRRGLWDAALGDGLHSPERVNARRGDCVDVKDSMDFVSSSLFLA